MLDVTLSSHEVSLDLMPGPVSGHHLTGRLLLCFSINFDQYIFRLTLCFKDIIIVCKMCTCITVLHLKNYAHGSCVSAFLGFYFTGTRIIILLSALYCICNATRSGQTPVTIEIFNLISYLASPNYRFWSILKYIRFIEETLLNQEIYSTSKHICIRMCPHMVTSALLGHKTQQSADNAYS